MEFTIQYVYFMSVCYLLVELRTSYSLCHEGMCSYIVIMEFIIVQWKFLDW